jgi:hypothetical protein
VLSYWLKAQLLDSCFADYAQWWKISTTPTPTSASTALLTRSVSRKKDDRKVSRVKYLEILSQMIQNLKTFIL